LVAAAAGAGAGAGAGATAGGKFNNNEESLLFVPPSKCSYGMYTESKGIGVIITTAMSPPKSSNGLLVHLDFFL
jgi:hypothetical protein